MTSGSDVSSMLAFGVFAIVCLWAACWLTDRETAREGELNR